MEEARVAEHICRLCVLTLRLDRVEEANRQLTSKVVYVEGQLRKERAEGTAGQEQLEETAGRSRRDTQGTTLKKLNQVLIMPKERSRVGVLWKC